MLFGIILIIIGLYVLLKFIFPGFAIDLNWSLIWPIILIVIGINSSIKFKKIDVFNIVIVIIGTICLLCNLNVIPKVNFKIIGVVSFYKRFYFRKISNCGKFIIHGSVVNKRSKILC